MPTDPNSLSKFKNKFFLITNEIFQNWCFIKFGIMSYPWIQCQGIFSTTTQPNHSKLAVNHSAYLEDALTITVQAKIPKTASCGPCGRWTCNCAIKYTSETYANKLFSTTNEPNHSKLVANRCTYLRGAWTTIAWTQTPKIVSCWSCRRWFCNCASKPRTTLQRHKNKLFSTLSTNKPNHSILAAYRSTY